MTAIVLATQNAKWIHASFGLRYLRANLAELRDDSAILEFEISQRPADVAEAVVDDEAFGALAYRLNEAGGGEAAGITQAWNELIDSLSDNDLDWLADRSENPAAWLCNRLSPA